MKNAVLTITVLLNYEEDDDIRKLSDDVQSMEEWAHEGISEVLVDNYDFEGNMDVQLSNATYVYTEERSSFEKNPDDDINSSSDNNREDD